MAVRYLQKSGRFGYAFLDRFHQPEVDRQGRPPSGNYEIGSCGRGSGTFQGVGSLWQNRCACRRSGGPQVGKPPIDVDHPPGNCADGGPGSTDECYYGTDRCGKRRFRLEDAGPDVPDDSCVDETGASLAKRRCEDGLMWSIYAPGKNPCAPNTDLTTAATAAQAAVRVGNRHTDTYPVKSCLQPERPTRRRPTPGQRPQLRFQRRPHAHARPAHDRPDDDEQCGRGTQTHTPPSPRTIEMRFPMTRKRRWPIRPTANPRLES